MKEKICWLQALGFCVTALGGTLLHFLYEWTGGAVWAALFSGVNESTWEHMKLLFFPTFLYAAIEWFFVRKRKDFWQIKLVGITIGLLSIPVIFYTYNGAIGPSPDWLNITIFFIAAAITYAVETWLFYKKKERKSFPAISFLALCAIATLFITFTFAPPHLEILKDPLTQTYGIEKTTSLYR